MDTRKRDDERIIFRYLLRHVGRIKRIEFIFVSEKINKDKGKLNEHFQRNLRSRFTNIGQTY